MNYIEFPNLWGLKFPISPVAFKVLGIEVYWYGIIIALAFMVAIYLGMKNSKNYGIESDNIIDLVLFAAPVAIIFARIYYIIFNYKEFNGDLMKMVNLRTGGLAIYGGIIGAILVTMIFTRVKKIDTMKLMDFGVPYLVLAQGIGRWGNFFNQEAYGVNTTLPWGMTSGDIQSDLRNWPIEGVDPNLPVHPTFLYESLWNVGLFFFLSWYRKKKKVDGEVFFLYMILYGVGRAFIEGLRTDSLFVGNLRISQVLGLCFAVVFTMAFIFRRLKFQNMPDLSTESVSSEYSGILKKMKEDEENSNEYNENNTEPEESFLNEEKPVEEDNVEKNNIEENDLEENNLEEEKNNS